MRKILKHFALDTLTLYLVTRVASGIIIPPQSFGLLYAGVGLTAVSLVGKPIINIMMLPINLITFGVFRWLGSALVLYLTTLLVPGLEILGFSFPGLTTTWVSLPSIQFTGFMAYIAFSFLISVISSFIYWLMR